MLTKKEIEFYQHYHFYNHTADIGGSAQFNPCSLLMFIPKTSNIFLFNVLFAHEFAHARLSSSVYGKLIFSLRLISLRLIQHSFEDQKTGTFNKAWKIYEKLDTLIKQLINGWILTQEGYATLYEIHRMDQYENESMTELKLKLEEFLKQETPYSLGLQMFDKMNIYFSNTLLRNIAHEIGNLDYISLLGKSISEEELPLNFITPDNLLRSIYEKMINYKKNRYIIWQNDKTSFLNSRESTKLIAIARDRVRDK